MKQFSKFEGQHELNWLAIIVLGLSNLLNPASTASGQGWAPTSAPTGPWQALSWGRKLRYSGTSL